MVDILLYIFNPVYLLLSCASGSKIFLPEAVWVEPIFHSSSLYPRSPGRDKLGRNPGPSGGIISRDAPVRMDPS